MYARSLGRVVVLVFLIGPLVPLSVLAQNAPPNYRSLLQQGEQALKQNRLREAAHAFQRAVDINPSSAKAHEGLGVALYGQLAVGNVRPSAYTDMASRAEVHLTQASELSPSSPAPLLALGSLESFLADHAPNPEERAERYKKSREALSQVISLEPSDPKIYLRLANLENDEFGPVLQQLRSRFAKVHGPIPDAELRHNLQQQYGALIDDAISNAQRASEMNANWQGPLLLPSRLFRERALIRDTQEEFSADMHTAANWRRQFLAVGGHTGNAPDMSH